jgi:hypothetical protein
MGRKIKERERPCERGTDKGEEETTRMRKRPGEDRD